MNVATSSQTVTQTTGAQSVQTNSSPKSAEKTADKSFDEEMKTVSEKEEKTADVKDDKNKSDTKKAESSDKKVQNNSDNSDDIKNDVDDIANIHGEINFTDYKYHNESQSILSQNIQSLLNTKDLMTTISSAEKIDYDVVNISESDADFFLNLTQNGSISMDKIAENLDNTKEVTQNIKVSSILMEKLSDSMKTNKPFRIDFDKNISVIIKVNKDGSLSANFIPGDKAVEQYLRNNISTLKQRFDEENLAYSELSYSNSNKREQRQKKENDNE